LTIRRADSASDYGAARALILEYTTWLDADFCLHRFDEEMADLPAMYGPPGGLLLLAFDGEVAVGCIGFRTLQPGVCEMKRLYVVPSARGGGLGRRLVLQLLEEARSAGFKRMVLDTIPKLATALALYREMGFVEVPPYYDNPVSCVTFMSLELAAVEA
jgi:GNAT superfamily N-acetyltransferase